MAQTSKFGNGNMGTFNMNAIVSLAPIGNNNPPVDHYGNAMRHARLVGDNFGTLAKNMRLMVVDLVRAATVPGEDGKCYSLQKAITAAKVKMRYDRLDPKDQKTAANNFTYARTIEGAWRDLTPEVQAQFIDGALTPSTLAKQIKDAEKEEVAAGSAKGDGEKQMQDRADAVNASATEEGAKVRVETKAQAEPLNVAQAMALVTSYVKSLREQGMQLALEAELVALQRLSNEIDGFRGDMAKPAKAVNG